MKINLLCDMLVDQDRYIEDSINGNKDPVGYKCSQPAVGAINIDHGFVLMCKTCLGLFRDKDTRHRLTVGPEVGGATAEEAITNAARRMQLAVKVTTQPRKKGEPWN